MPKDKAHPLAYLSESGAFLISRISRRPWLEPLYAISLGSQADLRLSDYLRFLRDETEVKVVAVYVESFMAGDGYLAAKAVREITRSPGRSVIIYKGGRSPAKEGSGAEELDGIGVERGKKWTRGEGSAEGTEERERSERGEWAAEKSAGMSVRAGAIAGASAGMEKRMDGGMDKGEEKKPEKKTEARPGADYELFRAVFEDAGALIADTIAEFESFVSGALLLGGKRVDGNRVALMSNAGFECVVMSDNLGNGEERLEPAAFSTETMRRIGEALAPLGINKIQDIRNPLDVTPVADDAAFAAAAGAVLDDPGVDCAVISPLPLGPVLQTLPAGEGHREDMEGEGSIGKRLIEISKATDKPFVVNVDSGADYDPLCAMLEEAGIPVFRDCDAAARFMRRWVGARRRIWTTPSRSMISRTSTRNGSPRPTARSG